MTTSVPTLTDINVHDSLDERSAVEHFLGKDLSQAEALFCANFLCYQEDLMWMGPRAFCFYVEAAIAYLLSPAAQGDSDAVNSFCGLVEFRLDYEGNAIEQAHRQLRDAMQAILRDFARYGCDPQIYGDLPSRYRNSLARLAG